jgi:magnesium-protoporphyrin IX monomethyl ester (oxidative) cyclase
MEYLNERYKIEDIDGIAYRRNGDVVVQQKQHFILDLDSLPYPARDLLHIEKYYKFPAHGDKITERYASLLSSRGCIANCIFCSVRNLWGKDFRMRSASNVLDEITLLTEKYEIKEIHFEDDNLTANKKRAYEIFNGIIERNLNIYWCLANGIALYTLNEDLLEVMKKSGCYSLGLAIESGSQEVLNKIIKKPLNLKKVKPLIKKIKELQIRTSAFFIIGFPGETKEQIYQTLNFASEIEVDYVVFYIATPFPGTQLYEIALRENVLISDNFDFSDLRWSKGNIITKEFTPEELEKIRVEYWQKINKIYSYERGDN